MALSSFIYSAGAPGVGAGTGLRAALVSGLGANWTAGALVTFDGGGATERTYFVLTHATGHEILAGIGEGASATGTVVFHTSQVRLDQEHSATAQLLLFAACAPSATDFSNELNTVGTDPGTVTFWDNVSLKLPAYSMADYKTGTTGIVLCFSEDVSATEMGLLIMLKSGLAGRVSTRHFLGIGEMSESPKNPLTHELSIVSLEGETDAAGNDTLTTRYSVLENSGNVTHHTATFLGAEQNDPSTHWTASNDPQPDGTTLTQTIPLNRAPRENGGDPGRLREDLFRGTRTGMVATTTYTPSNLYQVQDRVLVGINATDVPAF